MKDLILTIIGASIVMAIVYVAYWPGKTISYSIFYEDMVLDSIKGIVKLNCIKP